jgi:hypothetical protein
VLIAKEAGFWPASFCIARSIIFAKSRATGTLGVIKPLELVEKTFRNCVFDLVYACHTYRRSVRRLGDVSP